MANHASHAALPYPVKNARYTVLIPYLDADGDPTDPTTPDTEISKDNGAFADCAEEAAAASGSRGVAMLTLSGAETDCSMLALWAGVASGPKATLLTLFPRVLPILESGTAQAGAAGSITLAAAAPGLVRSLVGCIVRTTGGTGGGGTGGANNQARVITAYNQSTKVATVVPNWETNPDATTTYDILVTEMAVNALLAPALGLIRRFTTATYAIDGLTMPSEAAPGLNRFRGAIGYILDATTNKEQSFVVASSTNADPPVLAFEKPLALLPTGTITVELYMAPQGPTITELAVGVRDVDNTTPASNSIGADLNAIQGDLVTILAATEVYKKNVAVPGFAFAMELTDGTPATGKTVAVQVSKDKGAFATVAGSPATEIGSGGYWVDLAAGDLNADEVLLKMTAAGCKQLNIKIRTQS